VLLVLPLGVSDTKLLVSASSSGAHFDTRKYEAWEPGMFVSLQFLPDVMTSALSAFPN
jgi:hypothetical protein